MSETVEVHPNNPEATLFVEQPWDRHRVALSLINRHALLAAGTGLIPFVGADIVALTAIELQLISRLCDLFQIKFTRQTGLNIIVSLLAGTVPVALLTMTASFVKAVPVLGHFAGSTAMALNGAAVVYALGRVMLAHFESGGDLLNFDSKKARIYFRQQMDEYRTNPERARGEPESRIYTD